MIISLLILTISASKAENFLNFGEFFTAYFDTIGSDIPKSYKYIKLNFKNINQTGKIYDALQKGVYMDLMPNQKIDLKLNQKITQKQVSVLIKSNFDIDIQYLSGGVTLDRLGYILSQLEESDFQNISTQDQIMEHVYDTLQSNYFYEDVLNDDLMSYGAIKGMVKSLDDPYTEFFTPDEAKAFNEDINGEFQGIGAYLEKNKNGEIIIISPLKGSPAEKAGIQAQDIIIKINNTEINSDTNLTQVVKMIKGPEGTTVKLKVKRSGEEIDFNIKREKIIIENIESKILDNQYCYMAIHLFSFGINKDFDLNMKKFKDCSKYVFDLRNNPGGGLKEVSDILGYFIPNGEPVVTIKDRYGSEDLKAKNKPYKVDKNIIILINGGSASASEIFAGTIKDYIPSTLLVGEKTFGKGSVQSIIDYLDGSMLKYTQAKRYTGKSKRNIDKDGIDSDIKIKDNPETTNDEILDSIQKLGF
ncbi:MAG: S41 family peptidase [Candidatus Absconditicoccaceae bacterium]